MEASVALGGPPAGPDRSPLRSSQLAWRLAVSDSCMLRAVQELVSRVNAKYSSDRTVEFPNAEVNATFCVRPRWVFSLNDKEFTESPTRWVFEGHRR